jgi:hypothetical protein
MGKMKQSDVNRIKSGHAKSGDGQIKKGSFPAKAESIVTKREETKGEKK